MIRTHHYMKHRVTTFNVSEPIFPTILKVGAAWLFSLLAGPFCERFGRKPTILLASVVFTAGSIVMGVALSKEVRSYRIRHYRKLYTGLQFLQPC